MFAIIRKVLWHSFDASKAAVEVALPASISIARASIASFLVNDRENVRLTIRCTWHVFSHVNNNVQYACDLRRTRSPATL